ncbi:MAG: Spy/CpxP family protein refolding chaperone [Bacteroidales bacterium]|nr:Spy/CpxP family protein refolding chaperone [Bacteroidales bacterium]
MKTLKLLLGVTLMYCLSFNNVYSQPSCESKKEHKCCNLTQIIPNLTDEQKKKIEQTQVNYLKEIQPIEDQLHEKQVRLKSLRNANASEQEINKTIDEITSLENQIMKKREAYYKAISLILTDDQKVYFRKHCNDAGKACCKKKMGKNCK